MALPPDRSPACSRPRPAAGVFALAAIALASACGAAQGAPEEPAPAAEEEDAPVPSPLAPAEVREAVRGAVEQYRQAYEVRTLDGLAPLYSQGPDVEVLAQGQRHTGWDEVTAHLEDLLGGATEVRMRVNDVRVVAVGSEGASATAKLERTISDGVKTVTVRGVLSLTFRRDHGDWVIVNEHVSFAGR